MREIELKYDLEKAGYERIVARLSGAATLGALSLTSIGTVENTDTYFDRDLRLHARGWSLRVRNDGKRTRLTLKRALPESAPAIQRDTIQNSSSDTIPATFDKILAILDEAGMLQRSPRARPDIFEQGIAGALASVGLSPVFVIRTQRRLWNLEHPEYGRAQLAVDSSEYDIGHPEKLISREAEVEPLDGSDSRILELADRAIRAGGFEATLSTVSKLERGVEFYGATTFEEKVEAKIDLAERDDYARLANTLSTNPRFLPGFHLLSTAGVAREIHDTYYDTARLDLANAGCYLRVREEGGELRLYFRRMTSEQVANLPVQREVKDVGGGAGFASSWPAVSEGLSAVLKKHISRQPVNDQAQLERELARSGISRVLQVTLKRHAWMVESDTPHGGRNRIAKLKMDEVRFSSPDLPSVVHSHDELEVTGLEDETDAPGELNPDSFRLFLHTFHEYCLDAFNGAGASPLRHKIHLGSKYIKGLELIGRHPRPAPQPAGDALVRIFGSNAGVPLPRTRRGLLRLGVFVSLSAAAIGLFIYAGRVWHLSKDEGFSWGALLIPAGILLMIVGSYALLRERSGILRPRIRRGLVVTVATIAVLVLLGRFGAHAAADWTGIVGFPMGIIGFLALNARDSDREP